VAALAACGEDSLPTQPEEATPLASGPTAALVSNTWVRKADLPRGRGGFTVAVGNNAAGRPIFFLFGGSVDDNRYSDAEAYDAVTNTWTLKSFGFDNRESNGAGKIGSKIYISGGLNNGGGDFTHTNTLQAYDVLTNQWTTKASMPLFTANGVSAAIGNKLYVLPGECSGEGWPNPGFCEIEENKRLFRYDPAINKWAERRGAPHYHRSGGGAAINGKFYVVGGTGIGHAAVRDLDVYDPVTNTWRTLAPIPTGGTLVATAIQGKLFAVVLGGGTLRAYSYDPTTNKWSSRAAPPVFGGIGKIDLDGKARILTVSQPLVEGPARTYLYTP
jgi:N-acetylneuraminic acid mutarotase